MRFTIFQESRQGPREVQPGPRRLLLQPRLAVHGDRRRHGRASARRGRGADRGASSSPRRSSRKRSRGSPTRSSSCWTRSPTRTTRIVDYANVRTCSRRRARPASRCIVQDGLAHWAHVGDSRLYLIRNGRVEAQTKDHSRVQILVDAGRVREEAVAAHPDRNKIFNCLGQMGPPKVDIFAPRRAAPRRRDPALLATACGGRSTRATSARSSCATRSCGRSRSCSTWPRRAPARTATTHRSWRWHGPTRPAAATADGISTVSMDPDRAQDDGRAVRQVQAAGPAGGLSHRRRDRARDRRDPERDQEALA